MNERHPSKRVYTPPMHVLPSTLTLPMFTIDRNSWASIVSSVSEGGEHDGRFYDALKFHGQPSVTTQAEEQPK